MPLVFSYGSLQEENVQLATFGRLLRGSTDALPGYAMRWLPDGDPRMARVAGRTRIADVVPVDVPTARVPGTAFDLTADELAAADAFEAQDSYRRIAVTLVSGREAWVFVDATLATRDRAEPAPRVGVGVIVMRAGLVLVGERRGSHGAGTWALPGGHLAFGESIEACAAREVAEETGLRLAVQRPGPFVSDVFAAQGLHYVTLFVVARPEPGEPVLCEPAKCAGWHWHRWESLPAPLFAPLATLHRSGFVPEDPR